MKSSGDERPTLRAPSAEETLMGTGGMGPRPEPELGRADIVGRYVVLELIGAGATGAVYKAFDPELDRAVALKLLLKRGDSSRAHLLKEAQAIAKVSHPNVIGVHDVGTHEGRVFFAMELVDGQPLSEWRREARPSPEQILRVFCEAGEGLAAAHDADVVHRDFKPDNVLVDASGRVRVLDFGLAERSADSLDEEAEPSRTRGLVGTPAYMAPEQFAGEATDARTDQFAFCVALYEALAGHRPFCGDSIASLSYAVINNDRRSGTLPGVSARVSVAIDRGLSPEPGDRFPSMRPLLEAITPASRPRRGRLAILGVGALVVTAGVAYGLGRSGSTEPAVVPCEGAAAPMEAAWTDANRSAIEDAFERSGAHNASFMASRVVATLDAYAARWSEAARRSCVLTEVERVLDDELTFRAGHCIDEALSAFDDQLKRLASVASAQVESSLDGVDALPNPARCTERSLLELDVEIPSDPALRERVAALMSDFDVASAQYRAEENAECLQTIEALERDARALGHGPTLVRILELRSQCEFGSGKDEEARRTLMVVFERALASGHDTMAIVAAARIAHVLALRTEDFLGAEMWLGRAEALAERHGLEQAPSMHSVLNVRGILAAKQGNPDDAVETFRRLAEITKDSPRKHLAATANIGAVLANSGRPKEALEYFERAAAYAAEHWGAEHTNTAVERTRVAQTAYMLGDVRKARDLQRDALDVIHRTTPRSLPLATSTHVLATAESKLGNHDEALRLAREAYAMRIELDAANNFVATDVLDDLSKFELEAGNHDEAERAALQLLKLCEATGHPLDVARALSRLAAVRMAKGQDEQARADLLRAEALASSSQETRRPGARGEALYGIAAGFIDLGDSDRAMKMQRLAEAALKDEDSPWVVSALRLRFVGELLREGRTEDARALLTEVEAILEASPYPPESVEAAKGLRAQLGV